jgi:hypothetical protein
MILRNLVYGYVGRIQAKISRPVSILVKEDKMIFKKGKGIHILRKKCFFWENQALPIIFEIN